MAETERDETDREPYEIAKYCNTILMTGNLAHYPLDYFFVMSPSDFCQCYPWNYQWIRMIQNTSG